MHFNGRVWFWLLALAFILWLFRKARGSIWGLSLLTLPGTLAHEFSHLVTGWLLGGRPAHFSIWPKRRKNDYELGSVSFSNLRWYNAFFIGVAPLSLLGAAWGIAVWRLHGGMAFTWMNAVWLYLVANLVESSLPSGQDLRIAARSPVGWLLLAVALGWAWVRLATPRLRGHQAFRPGYFAMASTKPSLTEREV
jgi:hypothetical protein